MSIIFIMMMLVMMVNVMMSIVTVYSMPKMRWYYQYSIDAMNINIMNCTGLFLCTKDHLSLVACLSSM